MKWLQFPVDFIITNFYCIYLEMPKFVSLNVTGFLFKFPILCMQNIHSTKEHKIAHWNICKIRSGSMILGAVALMSVLTLLLAQLVIYTFPPCYLLLCNKLQSYFRPDETHPSPLVALNHGLKLKSILRDAQPVQHKSITSFRHLRDDVFNELVQAEQVSGVKVYLTFFKH